MIDFVEWDKDLAKSWIENSTARKTVAEHNSAVVLAASVLDVLAQPTVVAKPGSASVEYPKTLYHGPITDADGHDVPLVGSLEPTMSDRETDEAGNYKTARMRAWGALDEALRKVSEVDYTKAGTGASGQLEDVYPHGVVGVSGVAARALILDLEPEDVITEGDPGEELAAILRVTVALARDVATASRAGSDLEAHGAAMTALDANANSATWANTLTTVGTLGAKERKKATRLVLYIFGGAAVVSGLVAAMTKKKKSGYMRSALVLQPINR